MNERIKWTFSDYFTFRDLIRHEYRKIFVNGQRLKEFFPHVRRYMHDIEETQSIQAINNGLTDLQLDSVNYFVNEYGCRGDWTVKSKNGKKNVAFFGCSFTFGVGIDEEETFQSIVKRHLEKSGPVQIINLGFPGGSISKCAKLFKYLTNVYDIDIAIFLFPTHLRQEHLVRTNKNLIDTVSLIPNFELIGKDKELWEDFYKIMDEDNLAYQAIKSIDLIDNIGKQKKIQTLYTSWDTKTFHIIDEIIPDINKKLPYYKFLENMTTSGEKKGFARDGAHPGPLSHQTFAKEIIDHLETFRPDTKRLI